MKTLGTCFIAALVCGSVACGNLGATSIQLVDLPAGDTDTISIQLNPLNGGVDGVAGTSVGWGFTVDWSSTGGDWISFTDTSPGSLAQSETNPALVASGGYTDFIGAQGGPVDFGLSPSYGPWTESFDGISQGVGLYPITTDPGNAVPGAQDIGQITFNFQVYNGDPLSDGVQQVGDASYAYYGSSTAFAVTVDAAPSGSPEPGTFGLLVMGTGMLAAANRRRILSRHSRG